MFEVNNCSLEPNRKIITIRFTLLALQCIIGLYGFINAGSWILLIIWILIIILFLTTVGNLMCARCESYGRRCYSMYLGLYTSKLFNFRKKDVPAAGLALEVFSLVFIPLLPLIPLYKSPVLFIIYFILSFLSAFLQFIHACRHCAACSQDEWKKLCPAHRAAGRIWSREIENIKKNC
jgi:hypothetical protein